MHGNLEQNEVPAFIKCKQALEARGSKTIHWSKSTQGAYCTKVEQNYWRPSKSPSYKGRKNLKNMQG
jgi:hypothetical protein